MIKIISISNAHEFDGRFLTEKQFINLQELLSECSNFAHTVEFEKCEYFGGKEKEVIFLAGKTK